MTLRRWRLLGLCALLAHGAIAGCGSDDTGGGVISRPDSAGPDSSTALDAGPSDTSSPPADAGRLDTTSPDPTDSSALADTVEPRDSTPDVDPDAVPDVAPDVVAADVTDTADTAVAPAKDVRFVVLGDTGEGNAAQRKVAIAVRDKCASSGCDFAVLLGDNIYDAGVTSVLDTQWQTKFETPYADVPIPFYAVLGNHDNGGFLTQLLGDTFAGAGAEFERGDFEVDYATVSSKWRMPDRTYDFELGPAHFFALDTNDMVWSLINAGAEQRTQIQVDTFPAAIDAATATWTIAFGHHPYRSNGRHGNAGAYEGLEEGITDAIANVPGLGDLGEVVSGKGVKDALDTIVCGRVDLYFAGHDHDRQWFPEDTGECAGTTFVVSGAGSKLTDFKGNQPTLFRDNTKTGFFWVHLRDATIEVEAIDEDGLVQWSHQDVHR